MSEARDERLHAVLTGLLGRRVTNKQIWDAFGISQSRYYQIMREDSSQLLRADRLINAARSLGINPVELLVCLDILKTSDAAEYVDKRREEFKEFLSPVREPR